MCKNLLPEHASLVARNLKDALYYTGSSDMLFTKYYAEELIKKFDAVGIFIRDDDANPVGWCFMKKGM